MKYFQIDFEMDLFKGAMKELQRVNRLGYFDIAEKHLESFLRDIEEEQRKSIFRFVRVFKVDTYSFLVYAEVTDYLIHKMENLRRWRGVEKVEMMDLVPHIGAWENEV